MAKATSEIKSLARSHTTQALKTLVGIMNQSKAPAAARVTAANSILDRGWGKPDQKNELDVSDALSDLLKAVDGRTRGIPSGT
jgi:hypothetical protein